MKIKILTIFPEYFSTLLDISMLGRAQQDNNVSFEIINIRDFAPDKHHKTDARPFGGGAGMVMMIEPIDRALKSVANKNVDQHIVLTSAKGRLFTQEVANDYVQHDELVIVCGHYEGVDERVAEHLVDEEVRIGDYVLTGGEPAAAVITDSVTRLIPGVLGNQESLVDESHHSPGVLGYPQFTRPQEYRCWEVPDVLLSGHHKEIDEWRKNNLSKDNE